MSEQDRGTADAARPETIPLQARIEALRRAGAARLDPVRWRYVEALSARADAQPEAVRGLLLEKLAAAVASCEQRCAGERPPRPKTARSGVCEPIATLNGHIRALTGGRGDGETQSATAGREELASVRRFRLAWLGSRTQEQVRAAIGRKPANAGPLNSHMLVLESLAMVSRLSPDYLRRFIVHVQTLQWLDQASSEEAPPAKGAARGRTRPAARGARRN